MERIKIFFAVLFVSLFFSVNCVKADEAINMSTLVTPQNVSVETCNKTFNMSTEKLFYLAITSANANKFRVEEIQSKTGYILFTAVNKQFLASVIKYDANKSILKITPTNNVYFFPPGIVLNFFKYIEVNSIAPIVDIPPKS